MSYSKVRALARVATPANEGPLLTVALSTTAARVEERCQQMRHTGPEAAALANRAHERRSLRVWRDLERGVLTLTVELPVEAGELVCQALDKATEANGRPGPELEAESWCAQQADALVSMARDYLGGGADGSAGATDAYQVMIHVDGAALRGEQGRSDLPIESVKRLSCDGNVLPILDGLDGEPLGIGRSRRTVPTAIKRALWSRDGGCSFPGCTRKRYVAAHHVRHWADGGETSLDNTMLLCSRHHRLVHEGGYRVRKDYRGRWFFRRPDGRAIPAHGYQPDDMVDDFIDGSPEDGRIARMEVIGDSAESRQGSSECSGSSSAATSASSATLTGSSPPRRISH